MTKSKQKTGAKLSDDECMILSTFTDFAEEGVDEVAKYLMHVGITPEDISAAGDVPAAILKHYRLRGGRYDIDAVATDLLSWPPVAARVEELKRERRAGADGGEQFPSRGFET